MNFLVGSGNIDQRRKIEGVEELVEVVLEENYQDKKWEQIYGIKGPFQKKFN